MKTVTNLVIDRALWLTGRVPFGNYGSRLLNPHTGKMCCLGFLALARGASPRQIGGCYGPSDAPGVWWPKRLLVEPLGLLARLFKTNDSRVINDATREAEIAADFATIGISVSFVGEYTEPRKPELDVGKCRQSDEEKTT